MNKKEKLLRKGPSYGFMMIFFDIVTSKMKMPRKFKKYIKSPVFEVLSDEGGILRYRFNKVPDRYSHNFTKILDAVEMTINIASKEADKL